MNSTYTWNKQFPCIFCAATQWSISQPAWKNITETVVSFAHSKYHMSTLSNAESGAVIKRGDWSDNAKFEAGECRTISSILQNLYETTDTKKPIKSAEYVEGDYEISSKSGHGTGVMDRSVFDVLGIKGMPDTNRGGYYIGMNHKVARMKQSIKITFPSDLTVNTNVFFVKANITWHQQVVGVKLPLLRNTETQNKFTTGNFQTLQQQPKKFSLSYRWRSSLLVSLKKIQLSKVHYWTENSFYWYRCSRSHTQVPAISINGTIIHPTSTTTSFLRTRETRYK